jgi:hypothetical protein
MASLMMMMYLQRARKMIIVDKKKYAKSALASKRSTLSCSASLSSFLPTIIIRALLYGMDALGFSE